MIGFGSVRIIESADMVETLAHPLSTTQVVARVAGGPWPGARMVTVPMRKAFKLPGGSMVMHPAMAAELRRRVPA